MARHFQTRHRVTVYSRDFDPTDLCAVDHVPVPAPNGPLRVPLFARSARDALRKAEHDHVISFGVGDVGADVFWVNSIHRAWLDRSREIESGLRATRLRRLLP